MPYYSSGPRRGRGGRASGASGPSGGRSGSTSSNSSNSSGGTRYTTGAGRSGGGLYSGGGFDYEIPPAVYIPPADPVEDDAPLLGGRPPRDLGFSAAATVPGRRDSPSPSSPSSSSSSSPSKSSKSGSAGPPGSPGPTLGRKSSGSSQGRKSSASTSRAGSSSPREPPQDPFGPGLPPPPPAGLARGIGQRAGARQAQLRNTPNPFEAGNLPPPPPGPGPMRGRDIGNLRPNPRQTDRYQPYNTNGRGGNGRGGNGRGGNGGGKKN